ncbi:preprotein translocase subunit SecB [Amaricoccus macauensis]|uniref:Protein-export protein SecB n=1 Tax=Amaricoccus macauensis TaxID=57001 RepID=A0A840SQE5_9RHOB|nr:protein-export chaperone SecB [Amaricoccus macauensis]MBB5221583.1 preprotein translocase subunit SecB [Amaricoccus macauensis]
MADEATGEAAAPATPRMQNLTQYVRDLSFENIAAQKGFVSSEGKPDIKIQFGIDAQQRAAEHYEVTLKVKVESEIAQTPIFILELDYGGIFQVQNVPQEQIHPLLMIECPRLMFPFVRRIVSDVTRDGGYPPMNLDQVDFLALYRAEVARRQAEAAPDSAPAQA